MTDLQVKYMMRSPKKLMHFHLTGQLPKVCPAPTTPLLDLINTIPVRSWCQYVGVTVDNTLGFNGSRQFNSLHQLATWLGRNKNLIDNQTMPYQSWAIRGFNKKLTLDDLNAKCSKHPLVFESQ